jgi:hypothetical protein
MEGSTTPKRAQGAPGLFAWRRVRFTLLFSLGVGLVLSPGTQTPPALVIARTLVLGLGLMACFGVFERWPRNLPPWIPRWVLQVSSVAISLPFITASIFFLTHPKNGPPFYHVRSSMRDYSRLTGLTLFLAPWTALGALVRQREALVRELSLEFQLERSELERQAVEARLSLLQTQVAPHFLFNTLANVQALVDKGSPQAPAVLRQLIAYLRAAVPKLGAPLTTLQQELELVEAYLGLMRMRMPDRLAFGLHVEEDARFLMCPPMSILTLVENAVRHGIDPSEEGGRIDVHAELSGDCCIVRVIDSGRGDGASRQGLGTGLVTLKERLTMALQGDAETRLLPHEPHGTCAELSFPARRSAT